MSHIWSEYNKVVNAVIPSTGAFDGTVNSDIVDMEGYKKVTFLVVTGKTSSGTSRITAQAGVCSSSSATAIAFKYRTQIASTGAETLTGGDVPSALTDATTTGFLTTASKPGGVYIVEVDASTVLAASTTGTNFDHCKLVLTEVDNFVVDGCVVAVLSEPRYPQAILDTAIG